MGITYVSDSKMEDIIKSMITLFKNIDFLKSSNLSKNIMLKRFAQYTKKWQKNNLINITNVLEGKLNHNKNIYFWDFYMKGPCKLKLIFQLNITII